MDAEGQMATVKLTRTDDNGAEYDIDLPATYKVCGRCSGEGRILNPSIGLHAYSQEDFDREFTREEQDEYRKAGHGVYGVECPVCSGRTTVAVVDRRSCSKEQLKLWDEHQRDLAEYASLCRSEEMMGC